MRLDPRCRTPWLDQERVRWDTPMIASGGGQLRVALAGHRLHDAGMHARARQIRQERMPQPVEVEDVPGRRPTRKGTWPPMTMPTTTSALEAEIRARLQTGRELEARPFLCSGSPYGCAVAIIGINPGTSISFWAHWSNAAGFWKENWLAEFKEDVRNQRNQTRPRIEILLKELEPQFRVVELNLYPYPTRAERDLKDFDRDMRLFKYLLEELNPRFLFAFGRKPAKELAKYLRHTPFNRDEITSLDWRGRQIQVLVETHLSRGWKKEDVRKLGQRIRAALLNGD
jgi:hypothetical protein